MNIRTATIDDLQAITEVEARCFPEAEAASEDDFKKRLSVYPNHFWLLEDNQNLIGFVNGMVSNESILYDEMFSNADLHNESGQ